ncbi:MAG: hypothetical protein COA32_01950 [Fluviicola sp.]|nr:MAG: hypothetical protein COA32_01950 [Fluviicola sp.]
MGIGAGHIFDMIRRIKQNNALKTSRRSKKSQNFSKRARKTFLKFPKASEKKIQAVRTKYSTRNNAYFIFIILLLVSLFLGLTIISISIIS